MIGALSRPRYRSGQQKFDLRTSYLRLPYDKDAKVVIAAYIFVLVPTASGRDEDGLRSEHARHPM